MKSILQIIDAHKAGQGTGIFSVCSAHPLVIEASLRQAKNNDSIALIEATSNQVNQFGGYTGMQPRDFRDMVFRIAASVGVAQDQIILGGDHLGPNCWQGDTAEDAMSKSDVLIEKYVEAGFRKIHLDCSMSCADDPTPIDDAEVAARAARLCAVAEMAWQANGGEPPVYIVGTEVPVPGGVVGESEELAVTAADAALKTIQTHEREFRIAGLEKAWDRVVGLVVQPGVEFGHESVDDYVPAKAKGLSKTIEGFPGMVFEAHSTDYQTSENLTNLVQDHFAILKVGPGLTFALREAFWALDQIAAEWLGEPNAPQLRSTVLTVMREDPQYWQHYYSTEGEQLNLDMQFSLSDRLRYYWPHESIQGAAADLIQKLEHSPAPLTLIMQYLPNQYWAVRSGEIRNLPRDLIMHKIGEVLEDYANACSPRRAN